MPIRLRVRELAEGRGLNLSTFQREAQLPMTTARRVWFSTGTGSADGDPLQQISFDLLEKLATFFEVPPGDLLKQVDHWD